MQCCRNSKVVQNFDLTCHNTSHCSLVRDGSGGHVATSCLTQLLEAHLSLRGDLRGTSLRDRSRRKCLLIILTARAWRTICMLFVFPPKARSFLTIKKTFISVFGIFFFLVLFLSYLFFICKTHSLFYPPLRSHFQVILQGRSPLCPLTHAKICITPEAEQQQQQQLLLRVLIYNCFAIK